MTRLIPAAALALAMASPGHAQCRLCNSATTAHSSEARGDRITVEIETSLSFDRLVTFGNTGGSAVIHPDGSHLAQGSIEGVGPRAMVGSAILHGDPGRPIRVDLPSRIQ